MSITLGWQGRILGAGPFHGFSIMLYSLCVLERVSSYLSSSLSKKRIAYADRCGKGSVRSTSVLRTDLAMMFKGLLPSLADCTPRAHSPDLVVDHLNCDGKTMSCRILYIRNAVDPMVVQVRRSISMSTPVTALQK